MAANTLKNEISNVRRSRAKQFCSVLALGGALLVSAHLTFADNIPIVNGDFEAPRPNNTGPSFSYDSPVPDWSMGGNDGLILSNYVPAPYQGNQAAYVDDNISQTLATTVTLGATYTVTYYLNSDTGATTISQVQLLDGTTSLSIDPLFTQTDTSTVNTWTQETDVFTALAGAGDPLVLEISHVTGGQSLVDEVTATVTPEPASLGLLALSACGLLGRRRRIG